MKSGDADGARATLTRCVSCAMLLSVVRCCCMSPCVNYYCSALTLLPRRKHVAAILKFALLEYKHGFTERGRTIFEGLLSSEPKRLDLWNVYVDQEIACGEIDNARRLLERAVHLKLSTKKVKFFFKKFLSFEAAHGTPDTVQHVRDAAKAYVDALTS